MKSRLFYLFFLYLIIATTAFSGTLHIDGGTFTIIPIHGDPVQVKSIFSDPENKGLVFYSTVDDKEGFIQTSNIKNVNELLGLLKSDGSAESSQKLMSLGREKDRIKQEETKQMQEIREQNEKQTQEVAEQYQPVKKSEPGIESRCKTEWGTDYKMVEYCIKMQSEALRKLVKRSGPILEKCRQEWGTDYKMVEYCTKMQTEAKQRLGY